MIYSIVIGLLILFLNNKALSVRLEGLYWELTIYYLLVYEFNLSIAKPVRPYV